MIENRGRVSLTYCEIIIIIIIIIIITNYLQYVKNLKIEKH